MPQAHDPQDKTEDLVVVFQADPASVRSALRDLLGRSPLMDLCRDGRGTAELVLAEVLNNVAEHAYSGGSGPVRVTVGRHANGVRCQIVDEGLAMPGGILPAGRLPDRPDDTLLALPEGGFGWHLIRSLTSGLSYRREDGHNRLEFILDCLMQDHDDKS